MTRTVTVADLEKVGLEVYAAYCQIIDVYDTIVPEKGDGPHTRGKNAEAASEVGRRPQGPSTALWDARGQRHPLNHPSPRVRRPSCCGL